MACDANDVCARDIGNAALVEPFDVFVQLDPFVVLELLLLELCVLWFKINPFGAPKMFCYKITVYYH